MNALQEFVGGGVETMCNKVSQHLNHAHSNILYAPLFTVKLPETAQRSQINPTEELTDTSNLCILINKEYETIEKKNNLTHFNRNSGTFSKCVFSVLNLSHKIMILLH